MSILESSKELPTSSRQNKIACKKWYNCLVHNTYHVHSILRKAYVKSSHRFRLLLRYCMSTDPFLFSVNRISHCVLYPPWSCNAHLSLCYYYPELDYWSNCHFFLATLTHPVTNDEILSGLILPLLSNANTSTLLLHAIQIAQHSKA